MALPVGRKVKELFVQKTLVVVLHEWAPPKYYPDLGAFHIFSALVFALTIDTDMQSSSFGVQLHL